MAFLPRVEMERSLVLAANMSVSRQELMKSRVPMGDPATVLVKDKTNGEEG